MATIGETRTLVNNALVNIALRIWVAQGIHIAKHRRYWQGAWTHTEPPADGELVAVDPLARVAGEQKSWAEMGIFVEAIDAPFRLRVDTYGENDAAGYTIIAEIMWSGKTYARAYSVGPEWQMRTHDWREKLSSI